MLGHETRDEALADTVSEEEAALAHGGPRFRRTPEPAEPRVPTGTT